MHQRQPVALSVGVEDAVRERAHQRALLLAPAAVADRLHERTDLAGDAGAPGPATLHQLAHARLADTHPRGGLRAREPLQVAERGSLALASVQAPAQPLEQLAQAHAVVELARRGHAPRRLGRERPVVRVRLAASRVADARAGAGAVLLDRAAEGHEHEPAGGFSISWPSSTAMYRPCQAWA